MNTHKNPKVGNTTRVDGEWPQPYWIKLIVNIGN
jgi:hypothetical protein